MSDTTDFTPHAATDAMVDSLLTETAHHGNTPDEAFLQSVERMIDAEEAKSATTFRLHSTLVLAVAAALAIGLGIWFFSRENAKAPTAGSVIAKTADPIPPSSEKNKSLPEIPDLTEPETSQVALNYITRLQQRVQKADEAAVRGSQLMADGDYQGAIDQYRASLDLLPDAPMTEPRRRAYVKQYARASVLLATQRAEEGRYPESIALVEDVLQPSIAPDSIDALRLLERLNDPDYFSPALTPSHLERIRNVKLALKTARGYMDLGDYDRADREFHKALNDDPYNVATRRGQEIPVHDRLDYYDQAYSHTRAKFLRDIAAGWEMPFPISVTSRDGLSIPAPEPPSSPSYAALADNTWLSPFEAPLSTFSIDVDPASWTNLRGMIRNGFTTDQIPDDAVRIEEMINYFDWDYPQPEGRHPFAIATETAACPWNAENQILRVGIQGKEIAAPERPDANLVFLLDVSGSMAQPNKLPLVKQSISALVEELKDKDRISIVVYAGSEGLALPTVSGRDHVTIQNALDNLDASGSTNGEAGIKLAYRQARDQFIEGGINRVILCTDGEFNVGLSGDESLVDLVEKEAGDGIFLTVCGFGTNNLNDSMLEKITNRGNGNYFFIDTLREGRKVFLRNLMSTLVTIAKDVKIQIEFNPIRVKSYRLIGYANRMLQAEDFKNDEVDAGEVGAGHTVTALYEIVPAGTSDDNPIDNLRYQKQPAQPKAELTNRDELALVKLRYKRPNKDTSIPMEHPVIAKDTAWENATPDFRFASGVALLGMLLRENESAAKAALADVIQITASNVGTDPFGEKTEFVDLIRMLEKQSTKPRP